jgi:hypothetical protein
MRKLSRWLLLAMVFVVLGCGGGGGGTATTDPTPDPTTDPTPDPTPDPIFYLKASDANQTAAFGTSVAVDSAGGRIAVGAPFGNNLNLGFPSAGKVYLFDWNGTEWLETARVESNNPAISIDIFESFGRSVSLSGTGTTLAVGAPWDIANTLLQTGTVHVFTYDAGLSSWQWLKSLNTNIPEFTDGFGKSVAISSDGSSMVAGAPRYDMGLADTTDYGAVQVFRGTPATWAVTPQGFLMSPDPQEVDDEYGSAVAINADGTLIVVGAPLRNGDPAGPTIDAGAVYYYQYNNATTNWDLVQSLYGSQINGHFGDSVALAGDGSMLAVGAPGEPGNAASDGKVYLYDWNGAAWVPGLELVGVNPDNGDLVGSALAFSGAATRMLAIGAEGEGSQATGVNGDSADNMADNSGAAYLGTESAGAVTSDYYKASNTGADDLFGGAVALSSGAETLVVGARGEDGSTTDDGDPAGFSNAGAVYVY